MAKPHKPGGNAGKGRPKGAPNRATRELRALAQQYTERAVDVLAAVMDDAGAPHAARVTAAVALLDRGHGKPTQAREITGADGKDLIPAETDPSRVALALLSVLRGAAAAQQKRSELSNDCPDGSIATTGTAPMLGSGPSQRPAASI